MQQLELLAPAGNLQSGIAAISYGADAVYIGPPKFGARNAAGNSINDIETLVRFAHSYHARVYATLNTLLCDNEIDEALSLIHQLYKIGVDGIIIQDMGLLECDLPPIRLIASTQTHNYSAEKVNFLEKAGFSRIILARELSLSEIKTIRSQTTAELEFFVHGALCVSFSGQCYLSQAICGKSGNRGDCTQPCRSDYNLTNANNQLLATSKHLLSLKDLNLSNHLEDLVNAGISSFKIEGRLKDIDYVKNITALYRKKLDVILTGQSARYKKASSGSTSFGFLPDPFKSFNRGFTSYFINGRDEKMSGWNTQKSLGEYIGLSGNITNEGVWINSDKKVICGDGLVWFDKNQSLQGASVNAVQEKSITLSNRNYPLSESPVYRNFNKAFHDLLHQNPVSRKVLVKLCLTHKNDTFSLSAQDEDGLMVTESFRIAADKAINKAASLENTIKQLSKTGDTIFTVQDVSYNGEFHLTAALINAWRREVLNSLLLLRINKHPQVAFVHKKTTHNFPLKTLGKEANVLNNKAKQFYKRHGVLQTESAFEGLSDYSSLKLMTTRFCLKFEMNQCPVYQDGKTTQEHWIIENNHNKFILKFSCSDCLMEVWSTKQQ